MRVFGAAMSSQSGAIAMATEVDLDDEAWPIDASDKPPDNFDDGLAFAGPAFPLWKVIVLVVAFSFTAGAFGYWLARPGPPGASSVDAGFFKDMIYHHNQAVQMAIIEQANGSDSVVVGFATEIVRRQSYEIGVMSTKLDEWGYTTEPNERAMTWMQMGVPVDSMPGLPTADQMNQLRAAKGRAADALFLQLMSNHHRAGADMATFAYEHAGYSSTKQLAQLMAYVQATEINEFRTTAEQRGIGVTIEPAQLTVPNPSPGS